MKDALNNGKISHNSDSEAKPANEPNTLAELMAAAKRQSDGVDARPVESWNPDYCGEMDLLIRKDGSWWHEGTPLTREPLKRLFASVLRKDEDGRHYLVTPAEKIGITVDVAAFQGIRIDVQGAGEAQKILVSTNMGETVLIDQDHPLRVETANKTEEPTPLVRIRGRLDVLLTRPAFYELVSHAVERADIIGVYSAGHFFEIGPNPGA